MCLLGGVCGGHGMEGNDGDDFISNDVDGKAEEEEEEMKVE